MTPVIAPAGITRGQYAFHSTSSGIFFTYGKYMQRYRSRHSSIPMQTKARLNQNLEGGREGAKEGGREGGAGSGQRTWGGADAKGAGRGHARSFRAGGFSVSALPCVRPGSPDPQGSRSRARRRGVCAGGAQARSFTAATQARHTHHHARPPGADFSWGGGHTHNTHRHPHLSQPRNASL